MTGKRKIHRRVRGVTLVEMMIVIFVIAVLAAFAIPAYRKYVVRAQRVDATAALLRLASAQEQFYLQNNQYATEAQRAAPPPAGLGMPFTENDWYDLQIFIPVNPALGYSAQATADPAGPQGTDADCTTFTIDNQGVRTSAPQPLDECWR